MQFKMKLLSSLEKCFCDEDTGQKQPLKRLSMLRNERVNFQLAYAIEGFIGRAKELTLEIDSPLKDCLSVFRVEQVPVHMPVYRYVEDDNYLRTAPGLYPDLQRPIRDQHRFLFIPGELRCLLFTLEQPEGLQPGDYPITIRAVDGTDPVCEASLNIHVVDAMLPESTLIHTQWFHCDCLAQYYQVPAFSEEHWKIIENFAAEAVKSGVNMILTPVFTPPLDTAQGHERLTVQLVDVTRTGGEYSFGFSKLDRWITLMDRVGMKYFEISHLFTQWGCAHAPKIMATADGEYRRIFGWETDALGPEYAAFLRAFLTALVDHLKALGVDRRCYYHISDEPNNEHLQSYLAAKQIVWDIIGQYPVMDALSDFSFYESGAVQHPIPASDHIEPFLEHNVPDLWTYYCCAQHTGVSNRFIAMPGARTRIIGTQLFKFNIQGFLHWGFNFYNATDSCYPIDPYQDTCGEYLGPGGDPFSVYPGLNGVPYRSLHGIQFTEAVTGLRAFRLCEALTGRDKTLGLIEAECGAPLTFRSYPHSQDYLLNLREAVNQAIENALQDPANTGKIPQGLTFPGKCVYYTTRTK